MKPAAAVPSGAGATVLLVEDEVSVRHLVARFLGLKGFTVLVAEHGREAMAFWTKQGGKIDLLLTDVILPGGMSGRELAEHFQTEQPTLKVLFTSGYHMDLLNSAGTLDAGINFLQKPYRPEELLSAVRAVLANQFNPDAGCLC